MELLLLKVIAGALGLQFVITGIMFRIFFVMKKSQDDAILQTRFQSGEIKNMRGQYSKIEAWIDQNALILEDEDARRKRQEEIEAKEHKRDQERHAILIALKRQGDKIEEIQGEIQEIKKYLPMGRK